MYFANEKDGYILSVQEGGGGTRELTAEEYGKIIAMVENAPEPPEGFGFRLTTGLEWEQYELPAPEADPEITDGEALKIITGGAD